ncbi:MAG: mitochondrial large ribosomal subunit protein uL15m, partial [Paludibacteraceae bacterium]|nr:mitochondrial large ribosomal subunit protein uL15m [Paludibacteraceae bacterium]
PRLPPKNARGFSRAYRSCRSHGKGTHRPGSARADRSRCRHRAAERRSTLQALAEAKKLEKIGLVELHEAGFISKTQLVKILGNGELKAKLTVQANAFSKKAEEAITAAGGTIEKI